MFQYYPKKHTHTHIQMQIGDADRDLKCQHEGGSCEFFLVCWMSNGLLHGLCGGLLRGCCHRTAKSANTGATDIIDLTDLPNKDYGPVTNDPSEFYYSLHNYFTHHHFVFVRSFIFLLILLSH